MKTKNTDKAVSAWLEGLEDTPDDEDVLEYIQEAARKAYKSDKDSRSLATVTGLIADLRISYVRLRAILNRLTADGKIRSVGSARSHRIVPCEV